MKYELFKVIYYIKDKNDVFEWKMRFFKNIYDAVSFIELHLNDDDYRFEKLEAVW